MQTTMERIAAKLREKFPKDVVIITADYYGHKSLWNFRAYVLTEPDRNHIFRKEGTLAEIESAVDAIDTSAIRLQRCLDAIAERKAG